MEKRRRGGVSSLMVLAALLTVAAMPSPPRVAAALSPDYYKDSCPDLESIVRYEVTRKKNETVVTIPATLRLVFHDCMVGVSSSTRRPLCPPNPPRLLCSSFAFTALVHGSFIHACSPTPHPCSEMHNPMRLGGRHMVLNLLIYYCI
jgi:hypothetical protein